MKIKINCHSSIKIENEKTIWIDPFKVKSNEKNADIIFITHNHFDHYSREDIQKVIKKDTIIVAPKTIDIFEDNKVIKIEPNEKYEICGIKVETIPAYNVNKLFHPKENKWVGYILEIEGQRLYIAGDTDANIDNEKVKCDIAFIPIGGTYTMNYIEAANFVNKINPNTVIPIHYGEIVGTMDDGENFKKLLNKNIECKILIK